MSSSSRFMRLAPAASLAFAITLPARAQSGDRALVYCANSSYWDYGFSQLQTALTGAGAAGMDLNTGTTLPSDLTPYRLIIVYGSEAGYGTAETALVAFYQAGGTLMGIGDGAGFSTAWSHLNGLTTALGLEINLVSAELGVGCAHEATVVAHPLTTGVSSIWIAYSSEVQGGTPLATYGSQPVLGVEGRFILCGDSNIISDGCFDDNYPFGSDDNLQFFQNVWDFAGEKLCGNSLVEAGEVCDDGNTEAGDYCSADCTAITGECGDGVTQTNEECDPGAGNFDDEPGGCGEGCVINGGAGGAGGVAGSSGAAGTGTAGAAGAAGAAGVAGSAGLAEAGSTGKAGGAGEAGVGGGSAASGGSGASAGSGGSGGSGATGARGGSGGSGATGASGGSGGSGATGARGGSGGSGATGASGGSGGRGGSGATGGSGGSAATGGRETGGRSGSSGAAGDAGDSGTGAHRSAGTVGGCGCRAAGSGQSQGALTALLLALGAAFGLARRRGRVTHR